MKIIVSSKYLAQELSWFDLEKQRFSMAEITTGSSSRNRKITLFGENDGAVVVEVESSVTPQCIDQTGVRWDWIYNDLSKLSDRPIALELYKNGANVISQY